MWQDCTLTSRISSDAPSRFPVRCWTAPACESICSTCLLTGPPDLTPSFNDKAVPFGTPGGSALLHGTHQPAGLQPRETKGFHRLPRIPPSQSLGTATEEPGYHPSSWADYQVHTGLASTCIMFSPSEGFSDTYKKNSGCCEKTEGIPRGAGRPMVSDTSSNQGVLPSSLLDMNTSDIIQSGLKATRS